MRLAAVLVLCGLTSLTAFGQKTVPTIRPEVVPPPKKVEAKEIDLSAHKVEFTKDSRLSDPLKLTSEGDLKLSPLAALGSNLKVDFKAEYVLLFQWQGSGKDKLEASSVTKDGKTTFTFTRMPGATEDLREHSKAFVLPAGSEWKVAK